MCQGQGLPRDGPAVFETSVDKRGRLELAILAARGLGTDHNVHPMLNNILTSGDYLGTSPYSVHALCPELYLQPEPFSGLISCCDAVRDRQTPERGAGLRLGSCTWPLARLAATSPYCI